MPRNQLTKHGGVHMRLVTSEDDERITSSQVFDPSSDRGPNTSAPRFVRQERHGHFMQGRGDPFLFGSGYDHNWCAAGIKSGLRNAPNQTLTLKLQQLLGLAKPGGTPRSQDEGRDHNAGMLANCVIA